VGLLSGRSKGNHAELRATMPQAREDDLVIEEFGDELLIYDTKKQAAHSLGATATSVWRACDGATDMEVLSDRLDISETEIRYALDELEDLNLLEESAITVVQSGKSERSGITRRQMTMRSVKAGAAVMTVPLVYSVNVAPAFAAITPTPFGCNLYTVRSCGTSTACGLIFGCCCCCQGGGSCKTCGATAFCNKGTQPCAPVQGGGFGDHCSSVGSQPLDARGCCGVDGADNCGCGFGPFAGCCNQNTGVACTPSSANANCFNCCAGQKLTENAGSVPGCCRSATVNCCVANPPACCAKSGASSAADCCGPNPPACCSQGPNFCN
jgi:hypothetical protein